MEITVSSSDIIPIYEDPEWEQKRYDTARDILSSYAVCLPETFFHNVAASTAVAITCADIFIEKLKGSRIDYEDIE